MYENAYRENYGPGVNGPDFVVRGLGPFKGITHVEVKNPVSSDILAQVGKPMTAAAQGKKIGSKLHWQRHFWSDWQAVNDKVPQCRAGANLPDEPSDVLGVVDLLDVKNEEQPTMQRTVVKKDPLTVFFNPTEQ